MKSRCARAGSALLLLVVVACGKPVTIKLVPLPPPDGYSRELEGFRAQRNHHFATNPDSPLLASERPTFGGLEYFDLNPQLFFAGQIAFYNEPETLRMVTTGGKWRDAQRVGFVRFSVGGEEQQLQVYRLLDGSGELFLPFLDSTSGSETYPAGRYVDLIASTPNGPWELDFNRAYNPSCAYGEAERFVCPVTPEENRLKIRIAAGERGRHELHASGEPG